ncbi:MAG: hypothetical protein M3304_04130 [Actinomycetota bacterium]|nr:hypothetical protein [Actinomycetota bacterium]
MKTEHDPLDPNPLAAQARSVAAVRYLEEAVVEAPLEGIVFRYGSFYVPAVSEQIVDLVRGASSRWSDATDCSNRRTARAVEPTAV